MVAPMSVSRRASRQAGAVLSPARCHGRTDTARDVLTLVRGVGWEAKDGW